MSKKHTNSNLSNKSGLSTHVWPSDDLKVGLSLDHSTVVVDAGTWILDMDQRMLALNQVDLLSLRWTYLWSSVLMSRRN